MRYQTCNDRLCLPPVKRRAAATLTIDAGATAAAVQIPAGYTEVKPGTAPPPAKAPADSQELGFFLLTAFGFGLAAIFTPCVFPMIPITMSYFLNRPSGSRRESIVQAVVFCLGIIVLFSGLGLAATAVLGPFGIVQLGSNPWVNGFIAALFLAFGLSLLGAFEITIPSPVLTRLDRVSQKGGIGGHAADGADVFAGVVRLRGAVRGNAAGGVGCRAAARGRSLGMADVRDGPGAAVLSCWRCSRRI